MIDTVIHPICTVDAVITFERVGIYYFALIKRSITSSHFPGEWALPGGKVESGESCEKALIREVREETNLDIKIDALIGTYSHPGRYAQLPDSPRVSIAFLCHDTGRSTIRGGDDASTAIWVRQERLPRKMAFDHVLILEDGKTMRNLLKSTIGQLIQTLPMNRNVNPEF